MVVSMSIVVRYCLLLVVGCWLSNPDCSFLCVAVGCLFLVPGCRVLLSVVVVDSWLSGVAVGSCCWFLVVECCCRWLLLVPGCRVLLSMVVVGSWLSGVAVGGCCWFLVVGCCGR